MEQKSQRRVAAVGSAQTSLVGAYTEQQHIDLIDKVVVAALKGTGLRIEDVDFVIDSGSDFLDGRSISNCGFLGAMGANHKEESRVEEDGLWALTYAVNKIVAGPKSVALVIAYSKPSESDIDNFWSGMLEPFLQRPVGLSHSTASALTAQRYLASAELSPEDLRVVSEHAWSRAETNPAIVTDGGRPSDESIATPLVASDYSRPVDGAVAIVLAVDTVAEKISPNPVWVTGHGSAMDSYFFTARDGDAMPAAAHALKGALNMAGKDSADDFDLVEISATTTVGELMVVEALGLAEPHRGIELYRSGDERINPSGGALPADPVMATGLVRFHEALIRLARREGHEANEAKSALVHGTGGFAMQNHCVVALEVA
ncbi:MAG: 3-ketoacyl-CoA thiolase [Candidatus Leucobacter sulfamidivorax]|nr:3-ketoacyl-CoA thiolase [Candidatus Leucobacter sulfamidivorax]